MRGPQFIRRRSGPGLFTEVRRPVSRPVTAVIVTLGGLGLITLLIEGLRWVLL